MSDPVDPYLDPDTGILRNRVGARTQSELDAAESDLTVARLLQLMERPVPATGGLDELREIHLRLFQDVYDWAGQVRTVDIRKDHAGAVPFMPVALIGRGAGNVFAELRDDNMLHGMERDQLIDRLAHHYEQVNYLHPFREGNGRAQRVFWNRVTHDAGWQLDWRSVAGPVNDHATRWAIEQGDLEPLKRCSSRSSPRHQTGGTTTQTRPDSRRSDRPFTDR